MPQLAPLVLSGALALATMVPAPAEGQTVQELIDDAVLRTIDACVGPGDLADVGLAEALARLATIPGRDCRKACRSIVKPCLAVLKIQDRCGKLFLKGVFGVAHAVCGRDRSCMSGSKYITDEAYRRYMALAVAARATCSEDAQTCADVCGP